MKRTRGEIMVCQFRDGKYVHVELFRDIDKARRRKSALKKKAREENRKWLTTLETNLR